MRGEPYREKREIETIDPAHRRLLFEELRRGVGMYTGAIGMEKKSIKDPLLRFAKKELHVKTDDYRELLHKWIFEEDNADDMFSFISLCRIFELDIEKVRRMIREEPEKINKELEKIKRGERSDNENN